MTEFENLSIKELRKKCEKEGLSLPSRQLKSQLIKTCKINGLKAVRKKDDLVKVLKT